MADETIEPAFQAAIASGKINGAVICATDADGAFVYDRALGERTLLSGEKRPQRLDDMLYLASATKLIATVAALQCVEDGLLALDDGDRLAAVAPELASKQVLTSDGADDGPRLEPAARPITLEMLLTHTSGAGYDFFVPRLAEWRRKNEPPLEEGARRPVEEAFSYPLAFQPGTGWLYGPGLDWAGRIVERVTGGTLGDHIRRRICGPLGIEPDDVQFYPVKGDSVRARLVDLNPDDPECLGRAVMGGSGDMNKRSQGDFGGHGLFMTGADYVKVLRSLLVNDGKLLRPETVENMFRNHIGPEAEAGFRAALEGPNGVFFRVGTDPGMRVGHGLGGLLTLEDVEGWYGEGTLTWGGGLTFAWFIDPKNGLCSLCAIQASLPVDVAVVSDLKQTFRHDIYRKHAAWKKERQQTS
ncbi:hypothetical protein VTK56DRAFT_4934 [Thermocarpiscus australiensis]